MERELDAAGYTLLIASSANSQETEAKRLAVLTSGSWTGSCDSRGGPAATTSGRSPSVGHRWSWWTAS
jgi:hypothetical protein